MIRNMIYKDISTYRSEIMGWSILWIMMLHFTFHQIKPLGFVAQYGFAGVDMFLFVSGFGIYYSLKKDSSLYSFYKKRLFRIFPTYYLLGIIASIVLFHDNILTYLYRYSTIGFWIDNIYWEWYIPSLLLLYLLAPFLKKIIDRKMLYTISLISIICLVCAYFLINEDIINREHFFTLYRIPAFIFGMVCAYCFECNIATKLFYFFLIGGMPIFAFLYPNHHNIYNYKYFSLLFLLPLFIIAIVLICKYLRFTNSITSKIGKSSLEIYLIQSIFFSAIIQGLIVIPSQWHDILTISIIIVSSILGVSVHWLIQESGIYRKA